MPLDSPEPLASAGHSPRLRVLVVDDEAAIGRAVERMLRARFEVARAEGGPQAIARLEAGERFDAILCDLEMPEASGRDVHAYVARVDAGLAERIVFLTGGAHTEAAARFLASVPNRRLEKPFTGAALLQTLSTVLV